MATPTSSNSNGSSNKGRRFDEEFKREVAALAAQPGKTDEQVGRDLGVSAWSVSRWRRRYGAGDGGAPPAAVPSAPAAGTPASREELERQIRALQRELADTRQQREVLKKALAIFSLDPR